MQKPVGAIILYLLLLHLFYACTPLENSFQPSPGDANFYKTIGVGGSFMTGYTDGALSREAQQHCIPALICQQCSLTSPSVFNQVLLESDASVGLYNKPWEYEFVAPYRLGYKTDCKGVTSLSPLKNTISVVTAQQYFNSGNVGAANQNFAVPFLSLNQYKNPDVGQVYGVNNRNPFYRRIAGNPGTSTLWDDIKNASPSFVLAWPGIEEIFAYASVGGDAAPMMSPAEFETYLDELFQLWFQNGARGAIANIPDFRNFPFYTLIPWDNADLTQVQADSLNLTYASNPTFDHIRFTAGRNGFIIVDNHAPAGFRKTEPGEFITMAVPIDSLKCYKYGLLVKVIHNRYVLSHDEIGIIDAYTRDYNKIIIQKAAQYHVALVDMNGYFNKIKSGIKYQGVDINMDYVSGNFISLDGYHPTQKGYALIANEFLKAMNQQFNAKIPLLDCNKYKGVQLP